MAIRIPARASEGRRNEILDMGYGLRTRFVARGRGYASGQLWRDCTIVYIKGAPPSTVLIVPKRPLCPFGGIICNVSCRQRHAKFVPRLRDRIDPEKNRRAGDVSPTRQW